MVKGRYCSSGRGVAWWRREWRTGGVTRGHLADNGVTAKRPGMSPTSGRRFLNDMAYQHNGASRTITQNAAAAASHVSIRHNNNGVMYELGAGAQ